VKKKKGKKGKKKKKPPSCIRTGIPKPTNILPKAHTVRNFFSLSLCPIFSLIGCSPFFPLLPSPCRPPTSAPGLTRGNGWGKRPSVCYMISMACKGRRSVARICNPLFPHLSLSLPLSFSLTVVNICEEGKREREREKAYQWMRGMCGNETLFSILQQGIRASSHPRGVQLTRIELVPIARHAVALRCGRARPLVSRHIQRQECGELHLGGVPFFLFDAHFHRYSLSPVATHTASERE
jgi:hypothetical protein